MSFVVLFSLNQTIPAFNFVYLFFLWLDIQPNTGYKANLGVPNASSALSFHYHEELNNNIAFIVQVIQWYLLRLANPTKLRTFVYSDHIGTCTNSVIKNKDSDKDFNYIGLAYNMWTRCLLHKHL